MEASEDALFFIFVENTLIINCQREKADVWYLRHIDIAAK